ncbi:cell wall-binding repeat-containing protein [Clostridium ljungdahlii]|uniref:N-acetylmuramoyl-L-alanine amidase LytC n=1 Tax=Clostridium ljungdahlii TaxID=1538 RepID=A0A166SEG8_9CLOT|nr:cell wall-binding repeat-containing protein [Clostridium ljungdahlii]OAA92074.1 N-acetylmuramoyl-L-alanine amidase LytC precursor [Clostridium ljungdahlii]
MQKVISKCTTFLFMIGIALSAFGNQVNADTNVSKNRIYGNDRIETSLKISQDGWKDGSSTVVIAQGYGYADALCAGSLAKKYNAPIILSKQDGLSDETINELKRLKASKAFVIGGKASLSDGVESELKNIGINDVERLGGATRYETSVKIAESLGSVDSIVVASGSGYADSLSIAPIASKKGMPILLSEKDSLPDVDTEYIKKVNANKSYVIGGESVISDNIKNSLPNAQRIGGSTRFETNLAVLENFKSDLDFSNVYIAEGDGPNGNEFADALSGSALAAQKSAPLVLMYNSLNSNVEDFIKSNISNKTVFTALGGTKVVPDDAIDNIITAYNQANSGKNTNISGGPSGGSSGGYTPVQPSGDLSLNSANQTYDGNTSGNKNEITGNVNISADKVSLQNVKIDGTLTIDPGASGVSTITNVTAGNIVVKSGADHSIYLNNVKSDSLLVNSSNSVKVEISSGTQIVDTQIASSSTLVAPDDAKSTFGQVVVDSTSNPQITLTGGFENVNVKNKAAINLTGANVSAINASESFTLNINDDTSTVAALKVLEGCAVDGNKKITQTTVKNIVNVNKDGINLNIIENTSDDIDISAASKNDNDKIALTLYDSQGNLSYINQSENGNLQVKTALKSGKYHGFIKSSSTEVVDINEFEIK